MQIYRGMDIGTAKPTKEQRGLVYHHLIDIVEPDQPYSVGDYLRDARAALDGILAAEGTPIVVGGIGLVYSCADAGTFSRTAGGPGTCVSGCSDGRRTGRAACLYSDLVKVDPESAVKIHPNDLRRTIRALEVYYLRDRKLSDFQNEHAFQDKPYRFRLLFLVRSRVELYARIEQRVDQMLAEGLEAEVRTLMDRGYRRTFLAMQGLGYKQFIEHFLGNMPREETITLLKRDTRRYAKRQFTWFRREPECLLGGHNRHQGTGGNCR